MQIDTTNNEEQLYACFFPDNLLFRPYIPPRRIGKIDTCWSLERKNRKKVIYR